MGRRGALRGRCSEGGGEEGGCGAASKALVALLHSAWGCTTRSAILERLSDLEPWEDADEADLGESGCPLTEPPDLCEDVEPERALRPLLYDRRAPGAFGTCPPTMLTRGIP